MRTLEEVDKDLDKIKEEFDKLLSEKSKIQEAESKYFRQDVTVAIYTKDCYVSEMDIYYLYEIFKNNCGDAVVVLDKGYKYSRMPISEEEYLTAEDDV